MPAAELAIIAPPRLVARKARPTRGAFAAAAVFVAVAFAAVARDGASTALGPVAQSSEHTAAITSGALVSSAIGSRSERFAVRRVRGALTSRGGGLISTFRARGPVVAVDGGNVSFHFSGLARGAIYARARFASPQANGNRAVYRRGAVREWYANGALGLEQGFVLARRLPGRGSLTLGLETTGLTPRRAGAAIIFGNGRLTYGGLSVFDAAGTRLSSVLRLEGHRILLKLDDVHARYPITVDPFLQQGNTIKASGEVGAGRFGSSVAVSADGNTAVVGAPDDDSAKGAVWVLRRSEQTGWTQELELTGAPKAGLLDTGTGEVGAGRFGESVALSADGQTAIVGAPRDDGGKGAAWVFRRAAPNAPVSWVQDGTKVVGTSQVGNAEFGTSMALSRDATTAVIGGEYDNANHGAAWVYLLAGAITKLTPRASCAAPCYFGRSVATSDDGRAIIVGEAAGFATTNTCTLCTNGAAETFSRGDVGSWTLFATLNGGTEAYNFGNAVALSSDGMTAAVGGPTDAGGAAWIFTRSGSTWSQQGKLVPADFMVGNVVKQVGRSVALSADGDTALVGAPGVNFERGAFWSFTRSGPVWSQQGNRIEAGGETGGGDLGSSLALAADGQSALVGGLFDNSGIGAVWPFGNRPVVVAVAPGSGPTAGGTEVTIAGSGFKNAAAVRFGTAPATSFVVVSDSVIKAVAPASAGGVNDVSVSNSGGTSTANADDRFTYVAPAMNASPPPPPPPPLHTAAADTQAPTAPRSFRGGFARRALILRWPAAIDNVGVVAYELFRDGRRIRTLAATARRTSIAGFRTRARTLFTLAAVDAAANRSARARLQVVPKPRPGSVPRVIPAWARKLFAWQTHGHRGRRPATPARLPAWYAPWKAWQLSPYRFTR
jgi:hypothetical protein